MLENYKIKETPVSLNTAKLLKEVGFNETCFKCNCLGENVGTMFFHNGIINHMDNTYEECYLTPNIDLVVKWLRIVHNIHVYSLPYLQKDKVEYKQIILLPEIEETITIISYSTDYEENLEKAICVALKYLKKKN